MNRGLIEAQDRLEKDGRLGVLPRFMNRGLIEAASLVSLQLVDDATSPIHESGPH